MDNISADKISQLTFEVNRLRESFDEAVVDADFKVEAKKELFTALSKFQGQAVHPKKTATNPFYKGKYATLDNCISANNKLLSECGLAVTQFPVTRDGKLGIVSLLAHTSGQYIQGEYFVKPSKDDAQQLGSAITYLRRYSYSSILGLAGEDDDDGNQASGLNKNPAQTGSPQTKRIGERKVDTANASDKKLHTMPRIEEKLKDAKDISQVLALWTELTKDQQQNKKIHGWFSMRKAQLANEMKEARKEAGKSNIDLQTAEDFINRLNDITDENHLWNWFAKYKDRIQMLPAEDYHAVAVAIDQKELELKSE